MKAQAGARGFGASDSVVVATGNAGKLAEFEQLLEPFGLRVRAQSEWQTPEAEETGLTFVENALLKARNAAAHTGLPAIADDSGLVVPALGGAPGIYSARYSPEGTDAANNAHLLKALETHSRSARVAYFYCAIVSLKTPDDPAPLLATAAWYGEILPAPRGTGGFGYDPLFWVPEEQCASAELSRERKNQLSHRGQAVRQWLALLQGRHAD